MNRSNLLAKLSDKTGLDGDNEHLLVEALTHPSYVHEHRGEVGDNQRLEFLGDAVLNLVVGTELFTRRSDLSEGAMSRRRAAVVCERNLARIAVKLGLNDMIRLGRGEGAAGGHLRPSVMADAIEAVVGAVFVAFGYDRAHRFVVSILEPELSDVVTGSSPTDPKSELQQEVQRQPGNCLEYVVEREQGPDHDKVFTVAVLVNGKVSGRGRGRNKRQAEQNAAHQALQTLQGSDDM